MRTAVALLTVASVSSTAVLGFVAFPVPATKAVASVHRKASAPGLRPTDEGKSTANTWRGPSRLRRPLACQVGPPVDGDGSVVQNVNKPVGTGPAAAERGGTSDSACRDDDRVPRSQDANVLVPIKDVVSVDLADISEVAADSLGQSESIRVSMERFCKTLESVCRTEFSTKVDAANAGSVLGGKRYGKRGPTADSRARLSPRGQTVIGASDSDAKAVTGGDGKKGVAGKLRDWRRGGGKGAGDGAKPGQGEQLSGDTKAAAAEETWVPILELVEELVRYAMFSPISIRDAKMSEALAAEYPSAALVRPVFENLALVYDLLHRGVDQDIVASEQSEREHRSTDMPFEGRLLVFRRGNGVEETTGRLVLRKLDYLQMNAVGWLSQSATDKLRRWQERSVAMVDDALRGVAGRKDRFVHRFVKAATDFGLERDTIAFLLPAAREAAMKEQESVDDVRKGLRSGSRRAPVNLQRYGTRNTNFDLDKFSAGGSWPPEDDTWFWNSRTATDISQADEGTARGTYLSASEVPSAVLPRVTLGSVLRPQKVANILLRSSSSDDQAAPNAQLASKSTLSRLLSRCTIKEPTYDEVVVVYIKRKKRSVFQPPPPLGVLCKIGVSLLHKIRGTRADDSRNQRDEDDEASGHGLQLRVYRGVPLASLNAIAPDKKVEVRPQTALRLDLNTVVSLGLVLANLRFDSPVLVIAATASVVLLVVRTVVGYLNARVRVESFVSRDILDKTMGSNLPVLRHLAEEAAQQKSRHLALMYAALLQCAVEGARAQNQRGQDSWDWGSMDVTSMAAVSRYCRTIMKACVGVPWEAKIDVPLWLTELEKLKILVPADVASDEGDMNGQLLPLALEGSDTILAKAATSTGEAGDRGSHVVYYRLHNPESAVGELRLRWAELIEPSERRRLRVSAENTTEVPPWVVRSNSKATEMCLPESEDNTWEGDVGDGGTW